MEFELEDTSAGRVARGQSLAPINATVPDAPDPRFRDTATKNATLDQYRTELAEYRAAMCTYHCTDSDIVMGTISAHHARVAEIRSDLQYMAGKDANDLRTKQVDPFLNELEFQFKVTSRRLAGLESEARLAGGFT
jgi:hypothetical protein